LVRYRASRYLSAFLGDGFGMSRTLKRAAATNKRATLSSSCPAEGPGIHDLGAANQDVDGRDKPGHDNGRKGTSSRAMTEEDQA
jgi:hypothetical protein